MMKTRHTLTALALVALSAGPAFAQRADVRIQIDTEAIREVAQQARTAADEARLVLRDVLREVLGPEVRQDIERDVRSAMRDFANVFDEMSTWTWTDSRRTRQSRTFTATQNDTSTRSFPLGATGHIDLQNFSGDVKVVAGSGREVTVETIRTARGRTDADAKTGLSRVRVDMTHRADRLTIRVVYPNERQQAYSVNVAFVVTAPAGTNVTASTLSGDVSATGIAGDLSLSTTSGDVAITDAQRVTKARSLSGDVQLRNVSSDGLLEAGTMSGDVTASGIKARRLSLESLSGDVTARDVNTGAADLRSTSGDVSFDGRLQTNGRYDFRSHSGSVRLAVDGSVGFTFEGQSFGGSVRSDLPLQMRSVSTGSRRISKSLNGTFGDGSATMTATSFTGDITIIKR